MAICLLFISGSARAQISPGALSGAHSFLSGPTQCTRCHDLAKRPPEYRCLECHKDIQKRLDAKAGLHPSFVGSDRTGRACVACHSEHNGKDFSLIHWDIPSTKFDHHRAGYTLEGKHAALGCKTCHQPARIAPAAKDDITMKDLSRTFLGLSTKCAGCHVDEHRGQFSANCASCHNSLRWQDAAQYNHDRSRFALTGAHVKVGCQKCHTRVEDPKPYAKYRNISFQECTPCHSDPHHGAFQQSCQGCHATASWKPVQATTAFNHATTKFPLEGKHVGLACNTCHLTSNFKAPVAHNRCTDCHRKDPHRGQFVLRADGGDCAACHRVQGFKPTTFNAALHSRTKFPLLDRHAEVACAKCHIPHGAETEYRLKNDDCALCHSDVHKGQFLSAPHNNKCESCHTAKGFSPSLFTLARHSKTGFPLAGAHGAFLCTDCHKTRTDIYPPPPVKFRFEQHLCSDCHADLHRGQFAARMEERRSDGTPKGCEACHTMRQWNEITGFDHATTGFPLDGAHRAVGCESCHKDRNQRIGLKNVAFKSAPRVCSGCHEDVHGGQFSKDGSAADCAHCHRMNKWMPSTFDHATGTTFSLVGAHKNVPCALCHQSAKEISGNRVVMYRPTARDCLSCHGVKAAGGESPPAEQVASGGPPEGGKRVAPLDPAQREGVSPHRYTQVLADRANYWSMMLLLSRIGAGGVPVGTP